MKEFSIPLKHKYERPVIDLYDFSALIDTGAVIPVISEPPTVLVKVFNAKKILDEGSIGGFGGSERGSVYSIPNFQIGELIFETFEVFVPNRLRIDFSILLSATLFYGMRYTFDTIEEKFIVQMKDEQSMKRRFQIKDLDGRLYPQIDDVLLLDTDVNRYSSYFYF